VSERHPHGEHFVAAARGLDGLTPLEVVAEAFGVAPDRIAEVEWSPDVCHYGWFISRLKLKPH